MIEKILKEINRLKNELDGYSALEALDYIEAYINTLLEEPASEGIENEIERFAYSLPHSADGFWPKDIDPKNVEARTKYGVHHYWSYEQVMNIARHFAEWGKNHFEDKSEKVSEDLEEEITKCYKSRNDLMMTRKQFGELIHRFTEWKKQQMKEALQTEYEKGLFDMREEMMKDAVYGYVSLCHDYPRRRSLVAIADGLVNFEYAEKVKIIICKTEQQ